tara:strand:- start:827 stop:1093 length:267 start_codon:yes stop_codon:yes gene_type:complete
LTDIGHLTSHDDLGRVYRAYVTRAKHLESRDVRNFHVGQAVEFDWHGTVHRGTVRKLNPKTIAVDLDVANGGGGVRVSPSVLRVSEGA